MQLRHKTALVTGGAVRIGATICEALAEAGCNIVIHCHASLPAAARLARKLRTRGVKVWVCPTALSNEADCQTLIDDAWQQAGRLDILVNNAAGFHKDALASVTEPKLCAEFGLNLFMPILLTRYFSERVQRGSVITLLDRRIEANDTTCLPYSLSKKALAAFTREAALALAPRITVNGVAPGAVLAPPGKGAAYLHDRAGRVPLTQRTTPRHVAQAVTALLQMESVTGQIVYVDGGQHLLGNGVA